LQKSLISLLFFSRKVLDWFENGQVAIKSHYDQVVLHTAAIVIQKNWRRELFTRKAEQTLIIEERLHWVVLHTATIVIQKNWRQKLFTRKAEQTLIIEERLHRVAWFCFFVPNVYEDV